jgi:hypothetical protein
MSFSLFRNGSRITRLGVLACLGACSSGSDGEIVAEEPAACVEQATGIELPETVPETSGVAFGRGAAGVIWTHNDSGGEPAVYAVDTDGSALGRVAITGAINVDWEDMELGDCALGTCLYLGDVGDNPESRNEITVYRVPEPSATDVATPAADAFRMRYPDRPRDSEAIFVLPGERLYVVTKGRSDPVELYRYPGALRTDEVVTLARVQAITDSQPSLPNQVTGASSSPDGTQVAIRTYADLHLYGVAGDGLTASPLLSQSLRTLAEPQGEAVALSLGGLLALTSEAARGSAASMSLIRCPVD